MKDVAAHSLAAGAGIKPGDLLVSADGVDGSELNTSSLALFQVPERTMVFYSQKDMTRVELCATGIPPGLTLTPTLQALRAKATVAQPHSLLALWEAGQWGALASVCAREVKQLTPERGFMDKLMKRPDVLPESVAVGFLGAALYETGKQAEGLAHLMHFQETVAKNYTCDFGAVPLYYLALDRLQRGDARAAEQILWDAHGGATDSDRLLDLMEKVIGKRPPKRKSLWLGRPFPCRYELDGWYDDAGPLSLDRALSQMPESKLFVVCVLANYRANGPYNDFMDTFINYARYFDDVLHGLHVITANDQITGLTERWMGGESRALDLGLPVEIGIEDGSIAQTLRPQASPFIVVLDRAGRVVHEHDLDELDVWRLAASRGALASDHN